MKYGGVLVHHCYNPQKTLNNMILQRTLIDNSTDDLKMANILNQCVQTEGCNEIMIATGFWDLPGTNLLQEQLSAFLQRGGKLKLLIGKEPSLKGGQYQNPAEELLEKKKDILGKLIEHGIKEDYTCTSKKKGTTALSTAASIILQVNHNGWEWWKLENGMIIDTIRKK